MKIPLDIQKITVWIQGLKYTYSNLFSIGSIYNPNFIFFFLWIIHFFNS